MPKISERKALLKSLDSCLMVMAMYDEDGTDDFEEIYEIAAQLSLTRYLYGRDFVIPKNKTMNDMLWLYPRKEFRQMCRMNKNSFVRLLRLIENHQVFLNYSRNKQAPVWIQLMVVLRRIGCYGNGISVNSSARISGISDGTVDKYTERIFEAILSLKNQVIKWPSAQERREISQRFDKKYGLPNAVGIVDGTPVVFSQRPAVDGEVYFTRKSCYAENLQLICDDEGYIRYFLIGWPGTVYDADCLSKAKIVSHPELFFSDGEYIMGDGGYKALPFICTPFRQPSASIPHNQLFNELYSKGRVIIEQVNGDLKGRFASLRGIRTQIKSKKDFKIVHKHILVCLILHNLMKEFNDSESFLDEDVDEESDDEDDEPPVDAEVATTALELRIRVQTYLLNWYITNNVNN